MKTILTTVLLLVVFHSRSQSLSRILDTELPLLSTTNETDPGFDSIYAVAKKDLVKYLEKKIISEADSSQHLTIAQSADGKLRTYVFTYPSGGTRGHVSTTLVQWKKTDGSFGVYALKMEAGFYEIHRLPSKNRELYLLVGSERANTNVYKGFAQVAQIKNDFLILDYPAFGSSSSCLVYTDYLNSGNNNCIACLEYCETCKAIQVKELGSDDEITLVSKSGETAIKTNKANNFSIKFDGNKFVVKQ